MSDNITLETRKKVVAYLKENNEQLAEEYLEEMSHKIGRQARIMTLLKNALLYFVLIGSSLVGVGGVVTAVLSQRWLEAMLIFVLLAAILGALIFFSIVFEEVAEWWEEQLDEMMNVYESEARRGVLNED